ncbi:MAG TPA: hypothetical protein V6C57_25025 [Coleofasciculaceae cyanobacterium]
MMTSINDKLQALITKIETVNPHPVDQWQIIAIIESLGYTDRIIQKELEFPDARVLAQFIYERYPFTSPAQPSTHPKRLKLGVLKEFCVFLTEFSRSFVYAVPLIAVLVLEYFPTQHTAQLLPPELAALFTLATIASLSTSGGFVQMIQRRGLFYLQLGEMNQMRQICFSFLMLGMTASIVLSCLGTWFGFYRGMFADQYLILANFYYLSLSALWMLFAILSILIPWGTPIALVSLTLLFLVLRVLLGLGALEAQILTMSITLVGLIGIITAQFRQSQLSQKNQAIDSSRSPRISALVYILSPYFGYGILYFTFIFTDRIVAGLAINPASGLIFAINSSYQRSIDLSLLNFLLFVPLIEYLGYIFIRHWYQQAVIIPIDKLPEFSAQLLRRYYRTILIGMLCFCFLLPTILLTFKPISWSVPEIVCTLAGSIGYLLFAIGLLNGIILFSLNQATRVMKSLIPALIINLCIGYLLAHGIADIYAVAGLVVGAAAFMLLSGQAVVQAIRSPDYVYYLGGY